MAGIYSPTINKATLDEAPFAYRSIDRILPKIKDIVDVEKIIKPVYNYKDDTATKYKTSDESMNRVWEKYNGGRHC